MYKKIVDYLIYFHTIRITLNYALKYLYIFICIVYFMYFVNYLGRMFPGKRIEFYFPLHYFLIFLRIIAQSSNNLPNFLLRQNLPLLYYNICLSFSFSMFFWFATNVGRFCQRTFLISTKLTLVPNLVPSFSLFLDFWKFFAHSTTRLIYPDLDTYF